MSNIVGSYQVERKPSGIRQMTVSTTAVTLASATNGIPKDATRAFIIIKSGDIRWTDDGQTPTTAFGMLSGPNSSMVSIELFSREQIVAFKAIRVTVDAELNIQYLKS